MRVPVQDILGWMASLLTLATFTQRRMIPLRLTAIVANAFFIAYGALGHFPPVLALHIVLLPVNSAQLVVAWRKRAAEQPIPARVAQADLSAASPHTRPITLGAAE